MPDRHRKFTGLPQHFSFLLTSNWLILSIFSNILVSSIYLLTHGNIKSKLFLNLCDTSLRSLLDFYFHCKSIVNILGSRRSHIFPFPLDVGIKIFWYCPNSQGRLHSPLESYHMKSNSIVLAPRRLRGSVLNFSARTLRSPRKPFPAVSCKCLCL